MLIDTYEEYVEQAALFLGGLRLEDSAGDVGDADCVEASQWTLRTCSRKWLGHWLVRMKFWHE